MESNPYTTANNDSVDHSDHQRKRKACDTLADHDDDLDHRQLHDQLQIHDHVNQLSPAMGHSQCCTCVHCQCVCHYIEEPAAAVEDADYLDSLPVGYRFDPTDNELITHYLLKKINDQTLPKSKISEAYVYGDHPKDLVGNYPQAIEGVWYFFSSRNRKYVNGNRPNRKAGPGYWKATGPDKVIEDNGVKVGGKKSLVYHEGLSPKGVKTNWMMHEYVVTGYERKRLNAQDMKLDECVLCRIYYKAEKGKEQNVTNQQPVVASNDQDETLRANLEVENENLAVVPYQQACLSTNEYVNPQHYLQNLSPITLLVDNHLLNSNKNVRDQPAQVVTNPAIDNSVVVGHAGQTSFSATHYVEDNFLIQVSNQHMNGVVQNGDEEVNRHGMVHDQQACLMSYQDANTPTILQVQNNVVVQNHQNVGYLYDRMTPYTMSPLPLQMTSFTRMNPPLADPHSSLTRFNYKHQNPAYLPSTPQRCPPLPPRIVHAPAPQVPAQPDMYFSGQSSHPPIPSVGQQEPPTFQEGNDCDNVDLVNMFNQDGDNGILGDYKFYLSGDEQCDGC